MDPNGTPNPARLLAVHPDITFVRNLSTVLQPEISTLTIEHCLTAPDAKKLLHECSCHAVIVSPAVIIQGDVSVLTSSHRVKPPVPLIMSLRADEWAFARHWFELGVYDFIFDPCDPSEALESVQDALRLSQIRAMVERTEAALLRLKGRREAYVANAADTTLRRQTGILQQRSILRLEESKESLGETLIAMERDVEATQAASP